MALRTQVRRADLPEAHADWVDVNLALLAERLPGLDVSASHVTARIFRLREILVKALDKEHAQVGLKPRVAVVTRSPVIV